MTTRSSNDWQAFFPAGTRVAALPNWTQPRLLIPLLPQKGRAWVWRMARLYPATKVGAQAYKIFLRLKTAAGRSPARQTPVTQTWPLGDFLRDALPEAAFALVLYAHHHSSPIEKIKLQVWNERDEIIGYIKYSDKPKAIERMQWEFKALTQLPANIGPRPLKFGAMHNGSALLISPLMGEEVKPTKWPTAEAIAFDRTLWSNDMRTLDTHPKVAALLERAGQAGLSSEAWVQALAGKRWPIVIQHGDFAPWNLVRVGGAIQAFDWEFASMEGFPYLDLVYWILQMGCLVFGWTPVRAMQEAVQFLTQPMQLSADEARAIVRLTALDAYLLNRDIGRDDAWPVQAWRRKLME